MAHQISATKGAAFGIRRAMQQNLRNSAAYAEAAHNYPEVTGDRNASQYRRNGALRETWAACGPTTAPYGDNRKVRLPLTYRYYWMDRQGNIVAPTTLPPTPIRAPRPNGVR